MSPGVRIRPAVDADADSILALNHDSVAVLSPLDRVRLAELTALAELLWVAEHDGVVRGFLLAFAPGSAYDSVNYRWFDARFGNFSYVDRVVVAEDARGAGIGAGFYAALERHARDAGRERIVAEVDVAPPNKPSLVFHRRHGFAEVGRQALGEAKQVAMLVKTLERQR